MKSIVLAELQFTRNFCKPGIGCDVTRQIDSSMEWQGSCNRGNSVVLPSSSHRNNTPAGFGALGAGSAVLAGKLDRASDSQAPVHSQSAVRHCRVLWKLEIIIGCDKQEICGRLLVK